MTHPIPDDPMRDLIRSTLAFYRRFDVSPRLESATRVFVEEVGEFIQAAHDGTDASHIAEEAADVIVTIIGLCQAAGVEPERIVAQMRAVAAKNDAKTHETHAINADGKIARRKPSGD